MKAICITALVLLVLLLLLQTRLYLFALYRAEGTQIRMGLGVFRFTLYPSKPKKERPKKAAKPKKPKAKKTDKPDALSQITDGMDLDLFKEVLALGLDALGRFKNSLRIDELFIRLNWGMDDPADTAISYGFANAAMGGLIALLEGNFKVKKRHCEIQLDYSLDKPKVYMRTACSFTIWQLLSLGLRSGWKVFGLYRGLKAKAKTKQESVAAKK